jgi:ribosomal-protein-alanine N-acetyltransferase
MSSLRRFRPFARRQMQIVLPSSPIRDGGTALRPWRDEDLRELTRLARDPLIVRWTRVPPDYGEHHARAYLLQRFEAVHLGTMAPFAITAAEGGALLGSISLMRIDPGHRRAEVGYWLGREARGQGHATRGLRLICGWGMRSLGLERIDLLAATGNAASQAVAERAGFTREGVLRGYLRGHEGQLDMVAFGLLRGEAGLP